MSSALPWLHAQDPFPLPETAWGPQDPIPGLLAAGDRLDSQRLRQAYGEGIFPWFSAGQPVLWWSPNPRMVLRPEDFRLHPSFARTLRKFRRNPRCEIRVDHDFPGVIEACAQAPRAGQNGTWILPNIVRAYCDFHADGYAHSVETWVDGQRVGGLYFIAIGRAVFGESMYAQATDASKIALAALVCLCRRHGVQMIDCQQNTAHLASLGAREIPRREFLQSIRAQQNASACDWQFSCLYWDALLPSAPSASTLP